MRQEQICTGPQALDMPGVVALLADVVRRNLDYIGICPGERTRRPHAASRASTAARISTTWCSGICGRGATGMPTW